MSSMKKMRLRSSLFKASLRRKKRGCDAGPEKNDSPRLKWQGLFVTLGMLKDVILRRKERNHTNSTGLRKVAGYRPFRKVELNS